MKIKRNGYRYLFMPLFIMTFILPVKAQEAGAYLSDAGTNWLIGIAVFVLLLLIVTALLFWRWRQKTETAVIEPPIIAQPPPSEPFVKGTWLLSADDSDLPDTSPPPATPSPPDTPPQPVVPPPIETHTCPHCNKPIRPEAKFCASCGQSMEETAVFPSPTCPLCQQSVHPDARFCKNCGGYLPYG